ncbi:MAG: DUF1549 domain-containing protein, partial [Opitutales bacterium]|nr:DUF1549 domain-containing protein [Opitutales bacterium]
MLKKYAMLCVAAAIFATANIELNAQQPKDAPAEAAKPASQISGIEIEINPALLEVGKTAEIKIFARLKDGSRRDITADAKIKQSPRLKRSGGKITATAPGFHTLSASLERSFSTVPIFAKNPDEPAAKQKAAKKPARTQQSVSKIDELINENLKLCNVQASEVCPDHEFLRRLYLDATGLLPDPKAAEKFIKSSDKNKREKLVDEVLNSPQFLDMLTMRLADILRIKSEFPSNLWPNAAQAY